MNCTDAITARSSIRAYTDKQLSPAEISRLAECALSAPTAMNRQSQRFYFITDAALISEIEQSVIDELTEENKTDMLERIASRKNKVLYDAPLLVVIAGDKNNKYAAVDAGIAAQTLALAATDMGLGSVILGMPAMAFCGSKRDYFLRRIGMQPELDFEIAVAIGHSATSKAQHEKNPEHVIYVK